MTSRDQLKTIYLRALDACAPERLVTRVLDRSVPRNVVAIGKCAGALLDGVAEILDVADAFVVVPHGYRRPRTWNNKNNIAIGGHPHITDESFEAGHRLLAFVDAYEEVLFLISGGGSACVEQPLTPWFDERDLIEANARLVSSGIPIGEINTVRKHLSAIKGGRLAARVMRSVTLIYSDVATGALADVASGPTLADPTTKSDAIAILERIGGCDRIAARLGEDECPETVKRLDHARAVLIADNTTLTAAAAAIAESIGQTPVLWDRQIEMDVDDAARVLLARAETLGENEILIAGGEPTVVTRGSGKGGRCIELAVRTALLARPDLTLEALFGTSDGADGNSGVAAIAITLPATLDRAGAERALEESDSFAVAETIGEVMTIPPAGNNLRDLYLLARS